MRARIRYCLWCARWAAAAAIAVAHWGCGPHRSTPSLRASPSASASNPTPASAAPSIGRAAPAGSIVARTADGAPCSTEFGKPVCEGTIDPTTLGAGIQSVDSGLTRTSGKHFYCFPADPAAFNGKWLVHLVGTGSDPARDNAIPRFACSLGFAAVSPMYVNSDAVGRRCVGDSACFGAVRAEVAFGTDTSPLVEVDKANSIERRVVTLVDALAKTETSFAPWETAAMALDHGDWSAVTLSGHSQGSGMALMLAHAFAVEKLVMFGGVPDRLLVGPPGGSAPQWIADFTKTSPKTPSSRFYGFNHEDDSVAGFVGVNRNYDDLGLPSTACDANDGDAPYPGGCHRVFIRSMGCRGAAAHIVEVAPHFGGAIGPCVLTGEEHSNLSAWRFLLTAR